jgi:outer membrane protein OmpA-like peptidoglycan-associated protein
MTRHILFLTSLLLVIAQVTLAQSHTRLSDADVSFWVNHWSQPPIAIFGPEQDDFNRNMQVLLFPYNDHDDPSNPAAFDSNVQWLKAHPNVHFFVDGYASSRGDEIYNLALSQRRANWVKNALVSRGISEDRIKVAAGWGELYPVCPETNDACWTKNRLVRLQYSPD